MTMALGCQVRFQGQQISNDNDKIMTIEKNIIFRDYENVSLHVFSQNNVQKVYSNGKQRGQDILGCSGLFTKVVSW